MARLFSESRLGEKWPGFFDLIGLDFIGGTTAPGQSQPAGFGE
jgi:hypothetical protein